MDAGSKLMSKRSKTNKLALVSPSDERMMLMGQTAKEFGIPYYKDEHFGVRFRICVVEGFEETREAEQRRELE